MQFDEYQNHKWARNLAHARRLLEANQLEAFYRGEDLPDGDVYPGMRVMAAFWAGVEHEMRLRLRTLLKGAGHPEWESDAEIVARSGEYLRRFLNDMRELVARERILSPKRIDALVAAGLDTPPGWAEQMRTRQAGSEAAIAAGQFPSPLVDMWFDSCLRSVAGYNRYLIQGAVSAATLVKRQGPAALREAVDATDEEFMWAVSREFFATVLPAAGFEDICDLLELGLRGTYADQYYVSGAEEADGDATVRRSTLKNCGLAGVYRCVAEWEGQPPLALGYGICRYCEVRGQATMMITLPPTVAPAYRRVQSLGISGKPCVFELRTTPADDMSRIMMVQEKVFGAVE